MKNNQFKVDIPTPMWRKVTAFINIVLLTFYTCLPGTVAAYELISDSFIESDLNNSPQYQNSTKSSFLFEKAYYVEDSTSESSTTIASFHKQLVDSRKDALTKPLMIPVMNGDITIIFPHYPLEKIIGDDFVQARFIRSQIFNQLNRNLLSDSYNNEAAQIKALYNNAFEFADRGNTSKLFGDTLSQQDVDNFGQNLIWPELRTINSQQVLVPIVHLTTATIDRLLVAGHTVEFNGGTVALNNITIDSGTVLSRRGTFFNVANNLNISEGGKLAADGDLNLLVGGTLQNISGQITAQNNVKIIAGQYQQKTMLHRFATPNSQGTRLGEIASVNSVTGDVSIKSMGDISIKGGTVAGNNVVLQANGNIMLSSQSTTYTSSGVVGGWDESESSLTQLQTQLSAQDSISLIAAGAIEINASTLHAEKGTIDILAGQGVYILDAANNFQKTRNGKFGNTTIQEKQFQSIAVRSALNAGLGIVIATEFGDVSLKATKLTSTTGTDIRATNGAVNFLMTKEQETYFYNKVKEGFWKIKTTTQEDNVETAVYNQIIGGVKVHATHGLTIELAQYENGTTQQNGQDTKSARVSSDIQALKSRIETAERYGEPVDLLNNQLANLSDELLQAQFADLADADSSLSWMLELHNDPQYQDNFNVAYKKLVEIHKFDKTSNLSPAAMAIIAIAVAVAMGPAGFGALGAVGSLPGALGPALQAGLLSITTQATIGLASGQGLEETLKSLHRSDSIKQTVTAMVTAGVLSQIGEVFQFAEAGKPTTDWSNLTSMQQAGVVTNQVTQAIGESVVRSGISTVINGGDLGDFKDAFKASLMQSGINSLGQYMTESVNDAFDINSTESFDVAMNYITHAAVGCAVGAITAASQDSGAVDRSCAIAAGSQVVGQYIGNIALEGKALEDKLVQLTEQYQGITDEQIKKLEVLMQGGLSLKKSLTYLSTANNMQLLESQLLDFQTAGGDLAKLSTALAVFIGGGSARQINLSADVSSTAATTLMKSQINTHLKLALNNLELRLNAGIDNTNVVYVDDTMHFITTTEKKKTLFDPQNEQATLEDFKTLARLEMQQKGIPADVIEQTLSNPELETFYDKVVEVKKALSDRNSTFYDNGVIDETQHYTKINKSEHNLYGWKGPIEQNQAVIAQIFDISSPVLQPLGKMMDEISTMLDTDAGRAIITAYEVLSGPVSYIVTEAVMQSPVGTYIQKEVANAHTDLTSYVDKNSDILDQQQASETIGGGMFLAAGALVGKELPEFTGKLNQNMIDLNLKYGTSSSTELNKAEQTPATTSADINGITVTSCLTNQIGCGNKIYDIEELKALYQKHVPAGSYSDAELDAFITRGAIFNVDTKRFSFPASNGIKGEALPGLDNIAMAHNSVDLDAKPIKVKVGNDELEMYFSQLVTERQKVIESRDALKAQKANGSLSADEFALQDNKLVLQQVRYGEAIGEAAGNSYGATLTNSAPLATKLPGNNGKQGMFDQMYTYTDANGQTRIMIVEAKGGNHAKLGTRYENSVDKRYEQGSKGYTDSVISNMNKAYDNHDRTRYGINSSNYDAQYTAEVDALKVTIDTLEDYPNSIDYTVVHQKFDSTNSIAKNHFEITQFDQTPGT